MVKRTRKRNIRHRRKKNDNRDDEREPEFIAPKLVPQKPSEPALKRSPPIRRIENNRTDASRDDYPEAGGSSSSEEVCFIEQLPVEVLDKILNYAKPVFFFSQRTYLDLRHVCKMWCNVLSQKQRVYFRGTVPHAQLKNCGFEKISLHIYDANLSKLPLDMWEKIGCKVISLVLERCKILDQCWKNIIMHCCNLQSLVVYNNADQFCSPGMLRNLCITRKNLKSFEIKNQQNDVNIIKWIQIFKYFFKIFPNVTQLTSGCSFEGIEKILEFKCSKKLDKDDASGVATSMAYSLSTNENHHIHALGASSALRFVNVSLLFKDCHWDNEDVTTLTELFSTYKNLENIEIIVNDFLTSVDLLNIVFLKSLEQYSNTRQLHREDIHGGQHDTKCTNMELLGRNIFKFRIKRPALPLLNSSLPSGKVLGGFNHLQYLNLRLFPVTDDTLQKIFQHLIHLKTLIIMVDINSINMGISCKHYSINRLKDLEKLTLLGFRTSEMDDLIFHEFKFPKLHFLSIDSPYDPVKYLPIIGQNMPALVKIRFTSEIKFYAKTKQFKYLENYLVSFCGFTKNLRTIIFYPGFSSSATEILDVFRVCPSLRFIQTSSEERRCLYCPEECFITLAHCDPSTREVVIKNVNDKSITFII